jgi:L-asparaginase
MPACKRDSGNPAEQAMNIYLLYTGGTIGCVGKPLAPLGGKEFKRGFKAIVEPIIASQIPGSRLEYSYFERALDSANMQPSDWIDIANRILENYEKHDAFLILHGTDTMAWTSSALSFLLAGIDKPLAVTGSQLPLFFQNKPDELSLLSNTDALRNVLGAIEFMRFRIPEVCLYFSDTLHRGNRAVKSSTNEFSAFTSPNLPPLGQYGIKPRVNTELILATPTSNNALGGKLNETKVRLKKMQEQIKSTSVIQFRLFPACYVAKSETKNAVSLLVSILDSLKDVEPPLKGIIFEAFGAGNIPDFEEMKGQVNQMIKRGITLVDCTQVYSGEVNYNAYATGAWLKEAGVLSGYDMTPIAALTKLIVLLASNPEASAEEIQLQMATNQAGEMNNFYRLTGHKNDSLLSGQSLYSRNGKYQFSNERGGRMAHYDVSGEKPKLIASREIKKEGRLVMQSDCNLVFYDENFNPCWSSNSHRIGANAQFILGDDGKLALYNLYTEELIQEISLESD